MAAIASRHDELPTARFAALPRQGLPPAPPAPARLRASALPIYRPLRSVRSVSVPHVLGKAKLIIEVPIDELHDHEIAQITSWLNGRASSVLVRRSAHERMAAAMLSFARDLRARALSRLKGALTWTLSRLAAADHADAKRRS